MIKLCVFDMDGTVVNTIGDISGAMNRSLATLGYEPHDEEEYCRMIGDGMVVLCKRAVDGASDEIIEKLINLYKKDYLENCCVKSVVYEGMLEVIKELKKAGIRCAMLSNKPHEQVMKIAEKLFPEGLFDEILGKTDDFPAKPAPDSLLYIMEKLGAKAEETVYIGDSDVDIKLGKSVGVYSVGVAWGFRGEEELKGENADYIAYKADDLLKLME